MSDDPRSAIERLLAHPLEHAGQRVVTLAQMDEAHGRPEGTAGRNFRENRHRMIAGRHYFEMQGGETTPDDEIRRLVSRPQGGGTGVILLTEKGYLLLVKSFRDDLAWQVQERLVEGYFRARTQPAALELSPQALAVMVQAIGATVTLAVREVLATAEQHREAHREDQAFIPAHASRETKRTISDLAKARSKLTGARYSSERGLVEMDLRAKLGFFGTGRKWDFFPASRWPELRARIEELKRETGRFLASGQLDLIKPGA